MHFSSPFQILPLHITRLIVQHVVGSSRLVYSGVRAEATSSKYRALLWPLMRACSNFRAIAYSLYFYQAKLELVGDFNDARYLQKDLLDFGYPMHHIARDIAIDLDEQTVYSGKALSMLSQAPYSGCAFPLGRTLILALVLDEDEDSTTNQAVARVNIGALVQRIKQMAPNVAKIGVRPCHRTGAPIVTSRYLGNLVSLIFQLVGRIEYGPFYDASELAMLHLDSICNLSHINFTFVSNADQLIQLARLNALTLQSLTISSETDIDVFGLVRSVDGSSIVYPRLHSLKLWDLLDSLSSGRPGVDDVIPFPSLRVLRLWISHSLEDDTFFRGNAMTLERLEIRLSDPIIKALRSNQVFTPVSHPKLQYVSIKYLDGIIPDSFASCAEAMGFELSIGPGAAVREVGALPFNTVTAPAIPLFGQHPCIQVLKLPHLSPGIPHAIALIRALPLLSDLHTMSISTKHMPLSVAQGSLRSTFISDFIAEFAPLGKRLRCWHFGGHMHDKGSAICVLLLVLVCPNFDYVATLPEALEPFMKLMEGIIALDLFKQYAPRLRRLLFDKP
ncbi:hypothetical protein H4218_004388 [Coemansia sp. IMI 209128]|nr:hypothetical protein H4218_004388 [Coemansia sp. IMI 209128]